MSEWFKDWFASDQYLNVYKHRDEKDAQKLLDLISKTIPLTKENLILDAACGTGRYTNLLLRNGHKAIGFDLSLPLLKVALQMSSNITGDSNYFRSDIRFVPLKKKFDVILNVFTSFGYFETDQENFSFIKNSINYLNKDGYFVFDYLNKDHVIQTLVPSTEKIIDGYEIIENRRIEKDRVIKEIEIKTDEGTNKFVESVKLYSHLTIEEEFSKSGYKMLKFYGDYEGNQFDRDSSPRVIMIFQNEN